MISYIKKNYKFILFVVVVVVLFYFMFFHSLVTEETNVELDTNVFVVPEKEKKEKTKEELYNERFAVNVEKEVDISKIIEEQEKRENLEGELMDSSTQKISQIEPESNLVPKANNSIQKKTQQAPKKIQAQKNVETKEVDQIQNTTVQSVASTSDNIVTPGNIAVSTQPQQQQQSQGKTIYRNQQQNKGNSFKASIFGDQLISQTGLIKIRVTDKVQIGELSLERNDILEANVSMSGGIVNITIPNLIKNGAYYELNATGMAESGRQITYNESELRKASKDASGSVAASAAQKITGSRTLGNAIGSVISRTVSSNSSTTKVTLQDGYKLVFFTK